MVYTGFIVKKEILAAKEFEPKPPNRLLPKTSDLDHLATLPDMKRY